MTENEMKEIYDGMIKHFGDKVPDPEYQPKVFAYYLKLYRYYYHRK